MASRRRILARVLTHAGAARGRAWAHGRVLSEARDAVQALQALVYYTEALNHALDIDCGTIASPHLAAALRNVP